MSEAARSRRDDARHEPQLANPGRDAGGTDPLAELARLVGQDDPFRSVFRPHQARPEPEGDAWTGSARRAPSEAEAQGDFEPHGAQHYGAHAASAGLERGDHHDDEQAYHEPAHPEEWREHDGYGGDVDDGRYYAAEQAAHPDDAGLADQHLAPAYPVGSVLPDDWARGESGVPLSGDDRGPAQAPLSSSTARRPLAVLAAVLVLTGGGLAASFFAKSRSAPGAMASANGGAPTIMAARGPTKIKVDDPSATAPEDQDAALLNKSGGLSSGPVKIVSSQEQPADLGMLPKANLADGARPLPPPPPSPFPEPKKVKTFLVHPDGRVLSADGGAPGAAAGSSSAGDPLPATPKAGMPGGSVTPKALAASPSPVPVTPASGATIASLSVDPALANPGASASATDTLSAAKPARQPASSGPRTASIKPNDAAEAPGSYGVQLASSPVEADANAAFAKLKKKFPAQLGAYTATVHRAETGDKPVYRVRVGGMSQDEAKTLCSQLMNAGGTCVVMRR